MFYNWKVSSNENELTSCAKSVTELHEEGKANETSTITIYEKSPEPDKNVKETFYLNLNKNIYN